MPNQVALSTLDKLSAAVVNLPKTSTEQLDRAVSDLSLDFLDVFQALRSNSLENRGRKADVAEFKQKVNQTFLELQNLEYERSHILQELKKCRNVEFGF